MLPVNYAIKRLPEKWVKPLQKQGHFDTEKLHTDI